MNRRQPMKPESKNQLMIWAIVVLVILNLTTIVTVFYYRNINNRKATVKEESTVQSENASMRFSGRWFRDQLNLSNEQMDRFRTFNPIFRQQVRDINIELNNLRGKMLDEMSAGDHDTAKLNSLADSIGYLHADLKVLTYKYYLDFKEICNKEQKEKLDSLFGEMFAADGQTGKYGQRGPNGRGRGRRFMN